MGSSGLVADRDRASLGRSLSTRLDSLKVQYKSELASLTDERESLSREIAELQSARDVFLEETTMLNARNEELAQLNAHYMRRIEAASYEAPTVAREKQSSERQHLAMALQPSHTVNSSFGSSDESAESAKYAKVQQKSTPSDAHSRVFKWRGNNKEATAVPSAAQDGPTEKAWLKHTFHQVSVLRLSKCDHCSEKLWGSQARCQGMYGDTAHGVYSRPMHPSSLSYLGTSPLPTKRSRRLFTTELSPGRRNCSGFFV